MALFSIITICFNAEKEIAATVRSLREQSCRDFEHIVVDGASADNTLTAVLREWGLSSPSMSAQSMPKGKIIHGPNAGIDTAFPTIQEFSLNPDGEPSVRILSEPDKGLYDAMNKGLKMAKGQYVLFLNAGDSFADTSTLEFYQKAILDTQESPDIVYGDTVIVNENREILRPRHLSVPERLTFNSFSSGMLVCHQAFMVRRTLAPEYDLRYRFSADYDWCVKCIHKTNADKCVNLHRVVVHYLDAGLTDKNHKASLKERFEIMCSHYGTPRTVFKHISFAFRDFRRRIAAKYKSPSHKKCKLKVLQRHNK